MKLTTKIELPRPRRGHGRMPLNAVIKVLREDEKFRDRLSFNEAKNQVCLDGEPITDNAYTTLNIDILNRYRFAEIGSGTLRSAAHVVAKARSINPIRDYLESLSWDGVERLKTLPLEVLGVEDPHPLYGRYCEVWFIAAVARTYNPGCKVDNVLVFDGDQGSYKSTFFHLIASGPGADYFTDNRIDITSKDGLDLLNGSWIIEWPEFEDIINGKSTGEVKAFLSTQTDRYRPAYAACKITVPRRCIFCASTNNREVYKDTTGNRRFMTLPTGRIDIQKARTLRDQLWAEAVARFKRGEPHYLTDAEFEIQAELNAGFAVGSVSKREILNELVGRDKITTSELGLIRDSVGVTDRVTAKVLREAGWRPKTIRVNGIPCRTWVRQQELSVTRYTSVTEIPESDP